MGRLTFITGGAKSGKSAFALRKATALGGRKAFVATLEPLDVEMKRKVELHRKERGAGWATLEEPIGLPALFGRLYSGYDVAVLDCLTLWLSNVMLAGRDAERDMDALVNALDGARGGMDIYVVSNEVGAGIVPENEMARRFRDLAGLLNQKVAAIADEVWLMVSGLPVGIKREER